MSFVHTGAGCSKGADGWDGLTWAGDYPRELGRAVLRNIRGDRGETPGGRGVVVKGLPVLSSDVTRVLDRWCPDGWSERDLRALESIRGTVREWVVKAAPGNPHVARRLLRTTAMLAVWAYRTWGTTDPSVVLDPRNVEHWVMSVNADRSPGWRENTRGALRAVGRAANPKAWPLPKPGMTQVTVATPYGSVDETAFVRTARLAGRFNRAGRLWWLAAPSEGDCTAGNSH